MWPVASNVAVNWQSKPGHTTNHCTSSSAGSRAALCARLSMLGWKDQKPSNGLEESSTRQPDATSYQHKL